MRPFRKRKATLRYIPKKELGNDRIDYYHPNSTYGDNDHFIAFINEKNSWQMSCKKGSPLIKDLSWFSKNLHRRIFLRPSADFENIYLAEREGLPSPVDSSVAVLISSHNIMWNTVVFRFAYGSIQTWNTPQTDDEALAIIGRFDPQAMIAVKLLSISSLYMESTPSFSLFDHRARCEV